MTDRELMQMALEALEFIGDAAGNEVIAALRERLAQPEQEPPQFPIMLRKMWSGGEVQKWINENWSKHGTR